MVDEFPQAQVLCKGGRQEQAGIGHQAVVVKDDADTVGIVLWQHLLGAPCFRAVFCFKTILPDSEEHPLASSRTVPKVVSRWIRVKGRGSAQGIAAGILADVCGKSLSLTGTLLGGYSSTIFHLLYRFSPEIRTEFGHSDEHRWIQWYGFEEVTIGKPDDDAVEDGRNSRRRSYRMVVRERPGLVPSALFHIIGNTVFLRLADVASGLPDYEEKILVSSMDSEEDATGYSQRTAYNTVFEELKKELAAALKSGSKRLLATYLQTLLAYPDGCTRGETVFDPRSGDVIVQVSPLSEEKLYPKEKALIDLVAAERLEGRRVLVYVTHTGTRDITGRMDDILTRHGFRVAVMKADAVAPNRREKWVADKVKEGIDVLICHPRLVQTGLDLIDFPTIVWDETDYSVYVVRQASRRSWRIGQTRR